MVTAAGATLVAIEGFWRAPSYRAAAWKLCQPSITVFTAHVDQSPDVKPDAPRTNETLASPKALTVRRQSTA